MSKLKTVQAGQTGRRIFHGELRVCAVDNKKNYTVELMLLNELVNENNWQYTDIESHKTEVENIPILYSVINGKVGNSHDFEIVTADDGKQYASFIGAESEHPYGWIPQLINGKPNAQIKRINNIDWLVAQGYLPRFYNTEMINELEKNGGKMPISIETLVEEYHMVGNVEVEDKYSIVGVTILGVATKPAVKGANIKKNAVNKQSLEELKLRVASLANANSNTEPQTQNNTNKNKENTMKVKNLEDLKPAFKALGYSALKVQGQTVALLSDTGRFCMYTYRDNEDTIVPERINEVPVTSTFGEGDETISLSGQEFVGETIAKLNATEAALKNKTTQYTTDTEALNAKLNKLIEAETQRRKNAIQQAVKAHFEKNKKHCSFEVDEHMCDDLLTDEIVNKYAEMVDVNGEFIGDKEIKKDVDSRFMEKMREEDEKKQIRKNAQSKTFLWSDFANDGGANGDIIDNVDAMIARTMK